ncbi:hypothetical protein [Bosea sp. 117]|uniref:hypothetical protein n=1 Tax=Bosea sp. 117 TaxID=1125973 RepID=UPI000494728B|nr:hypothetical protein [Bosea sp. 117]
MRSVPVKVIAGAALVATLAAAAVPVLGIVRSDAAPLASGAEHADLWSCEAPPVEAGAGPMLDPAAARFVAGALLSVQETMLGIRPDQMEAWRGYTGALIAFLPSGERLARWTDREKREAAEAFDLVQDIVAAATERAEKAQHLQQAVSKLKAVLSPEQMKAARQMQQKLVERVIRFVEWRRGEPLQAPL